MPIKPWQPNGVTTKRNDTRKSASERGYGWAWKKCRDAVMAEEPLCVVCLVYHRFGKEPELRYADECHHIVPTTVKPDWFHKRSNLMPLCYQHHAEQDEIEQELYGPVELRTSRMYVRPPLQEIKHLLPTPEELMELKKRAKKKRKNH